MDEGAFTERAPPRDAKPRAVWETHESRVLELHCSCDGRLFRVERHGGGEKTIAICAGCDAQHVIVEN